MAGGGDTFIIETSLLVFGLIIVFAIERTVEVRSRHNERYFELVETFSQSVRSNRWSPRDVIGVQKTLVDLDRMQDPVARHLAETAAVRQIEALPDSSGTRSAALIAALRVWTATKLNFFPRNHLFLISLFGTILSGQLVMLSTEAARPVSFFVVLLCAVIFYMVAFLWEQSHPFASRHAAVHLLHQRALQDLSASEAGDAPDLVRLDLGSETVPVLRSTRDKLEAKLAEATEPMERIIGPLILLLALGLCLFWILRG